MTLWVASCVAALIVIVNSVALARTVVLVYDDSASMREDAREIYANYAVQNLVALLDPGDTLDIVRMQFPDDPIALLPDDDPARGIATVASWTVPERAGTPYRSVETAIDRLTELRSDVEPDRDTGDYWLVVFSDGDFDIFQNADDPLGSARSRIGQDVQDLRTSFVGRRLGVLFLGIGPVVRGYSDVWRDAGATAFSVDDGDQIAEAMFDIAALITGRDPSSTGRSVGLDAFPTGVDDVVRVETDLPLRRLVVFHQSDANTTVRVDASASTLSSNGVDYPLGSTGPLETQAGALFGVVDVVTGERQDQVMGPGSFQIAFDEANWALDDLRFLPEVALDLVVDVDRVPDLICAGDSVTLSAALVEPESLAAVDLAELAELSVTATVEDGEARSTVPFTVDQAGRLHAPIRLSEGRSIVSVTARYPGYFNLRSRVFQFDAVPCATDARIATDTSTVSAATRIAVGEDRIEGVDVTFDGVDATLAANVSLIVDGLPDGWSVEIAGRRASAIDRRASAVIAARNGVVPITLYRSERAVPGTATVDVTVESEDPRLRFAVDRVTLELRTVPIAVDVQVPRWDPVDVSRTSSDAFEVVAQRPYRVVASASDEDLAGLRLDVTAAPLREGVLVRVADVELTSAATTATVGWDALADATVQLARSARFDPSQTQTIQVSLSSTDPRVAIGRGDVTLDVRELRFGYAVTPARADPLDVTRVAGAGLERAGTLRLGVAPVGGAAAPVDSIVALTADGLPDGIVLIVDGITIDASDDVVTLPLQRAERVDVEVWRDGSFDGSSADVTIRIRSVDGLVDIPGGRDTFSFAITSAAQRVQLAQSNLGPFPFTQGVAGSTTEVVRAPFSFREAPGSAALTDVSVSITAPDLPDGVTVGIGDAVIASATDVATSPLSALRETTIVVTTDDRFDPRTDVSFDLMFADPLGIVAWTPDRVTIEMSYAPRVLAVEAVRPSTVTIDRSVEQAFEPVATGHLVVRDVGRTPIRAGSALRLRVLGLPQGLEVGIGDVRLQDDGGAVTVDAAGADAVAWTLFRNEAFEEAGETVVTFEVASVDGAFDVQPSSAQVTVAARPRELRLMHDDDWRVPLAGMRSSEPLTVTPTVGGDGAPVRSSELARWRVDVEAPGRLTAHATIDEERQVIDLVVRPANWALFTRTGATTLQLRAVTPFGERFEDTVELTIVDMPFVARWGPPIALLAAMTFVLWWFASWLQKPKFPRDAGLKKSSLAPYDYRSSMYLEPPDDGFERTALGYTRFDRAKKGWTWTWPRGPQRSVIGSSAGSLSFDAVRDGTDVVLQSDPRRVAHTSATVWPSITVNGRRVDRSEPFRVAAGDVLRITMSEEDDDAGIHQELEYVLSLPRSR